MHALRYLVVVQLSLQMGFHVLLAHPNRRRLAFHLVFVFVFILRTCKKIALCGSALLFQALERLRKGLLRFRVFVQGLTFWTSWK